MFEDIQMERCMKCFGQCIREGPMEMRVRHLEALSDLLRLEVKCVRIRKITKKYQKTTNKNIFVL